MACGFPRMVVERAYMPPLLSRAGGTPAAPPHHRGSSPVTPEGNGRGGSASYGPPTAAAGTGAGAGRRRPPRQRSGRCGDLLPGLDALDERPEDGVDLGLPAGAAEHPVVTDAGLQVVVLVRFRDPGAQLVGGLGLPGRADVVPGAFDGEQGRAGDGTGVDGLAAPGEPPGGEVVFLEDAADRLEVELRGHVHHRAVLVVEGAGVRGAGGVAGHQV